VTDTSSCYVLFFASKVGAPTRCNLENKRIFAHVMTTENSYGMKYMCHAVVVFQGLTICGVWPGY